MRKFRRNIYFRHKVQELYSILMQSKSIVCQNNLYYGLIAEEILRTFLKDVMPKRYGVCQGFVENNSNLSRQCDIIIFDQTDFAPTYSFGEIKIIPSVAVTAIIEVKTNIDAETFHNTLIAFEELARMGVSNKYLFLYDGPTIKTIEKYFYPAKGDNTGVFVGEPIYDHGDEYMLPSAILNLKRDYYLQQDLVPDVDMMGYMAYKSVDKGGVRIACLQSFIEKIISLTLTQMKKDTLPPIFMSKNEEQDNEDDLDDMEVIGGFGLFRL